MQHEISTLQANAERYRIKVDQCADIIKQLTGTTPEGFTVTYSIRGVPITVFDIGENEGDFTLSFFMSWHSFYSRKLADAAKVLTSLGAATALSTQEYSPSTLQKYGF